MAIKRIVCATDFSALANRAAHVGAEIAARSGARLTALYVDQPPELSSLGPDFAALVRSDLTSFSRAQDRFVEASSRELCGELRSRHGVEADSALVRTRAAEGIAEYVAREQADLLVIGHHGAGAHRLFLGSVAGRVSRRVVVPTLVVPEASDGELPPGGRMLVAVDLLEAHSLAVARGALELARPGGKLELFHALHEPAFTALGDVLATPELGNLFATARVCALESLGVLAGQLETEGVEIGWGVDDRTPARAVLSRAEIFEADLIAVGAHGRRGIDRLIGTTAERVLRRAEVPVLLVPTS